MCNPVRSNQPLQIFATAAEKATDSYILRLTNIDQHQLLNVIDSHEISGAVGVSGRGADAIFGPIRAPHARTLANDFLREQKRYLGL